MGTSPEGVPVTPYRQIEPRKSESFFRRLMCAVGIHRWVQSYTWRSSFRDWHVDQERGLTYRTCMSCGAISSAD